MSLRGTVDPTVYRGLYDVLRRHPATTQVRYEPDAIVKRSLRATVAPKRITPETGPDPPRIDVEWRFVDHEPYYRIHYADPNTGFDCGWHRDDDHPELGPVHFQYCNPQIGETVHESATFEKTVPTELCLSALDRLFEERVPVLTDGS